MKINQKAKEALVIGGICATSYFAVYIARNVLSVVTPGMVENGDFTIKFYF